MDVVALPVAPRGWVSRELKAPIAVELAGGEAELIGSYDVPEIENVELLQGRSTTIHIVGDGAWRRITVADVRSLVGA